MFQNDERRLDEFLSSDLTLYGRGVYNKYIISLPLLWSMVSHFSFTSYIWVLLGLKGYEVERMRRGMENEIEMTTNHCHLMK